MRVDVATKLQALRKNVDEWLNAYHFGRARFFDPKNVLDLFSRYEALNSLLRSTYSSYFEDLPNREVKPRGTTDFEGRGYVTRERLEILLMDIDYCLNILSGMTTASISEMKVTREGFFFSGQCFDAIQLVADILSNAKQNIVIIDNYVDEKVLSLLTTKNSNVDVNILTMDISPSFKAKAIEFKKQYGRLYIRISKEFHDRFIMIDAHDFYHFGASIKNLGNKGFMFSRIEEPEIVKSLSTRFSQEWAKAKVEI